MILPDRHRRASVDEEPPSVGYEIVEFETGPVARRRRGLDPVIVGAILVTGLLVAAVMKPWGEAPAALERSDDARPPPRRAAADATRRPPSPDPPPGMRRPAFVLPVPVMADRTPLPPRRLVLAALGTYEGWGARAILEMSERGPEPALGPHARLVELWAPAAPPRPGGLSSRGPAASDAVVLPIGRLVPRLIGITIPDGVVVRGVHVTIARPLGRRSRINVVAVPDGHRGALLFAPATLDGRISPWPAGTYAIAMEVDGVSTAVIVVLDPSRPPA